MLGFDGFNSGTLQINEMHYVPSSVTKIVHLIDGLPIK
jgi:hypothetical protein